MGLGLIGAIGAQNLFLIKQAMRRQNALFCALVCFVCDVILIGLSITAMHHLLVYLPLLQKALLIVGVIFLVIYASLSLRNVFVGDYAEVANMSLGNNSTTSYSKLLLIAMGFSLLNPNAILDTIVILGGVASHYSGVEQYEFALGAITASAIWFFSLVILVQWLASTMNRAIVWRSIELLSAIIMYSIALQCLLLLAR